MKKIIIALFLASLVSHLSAQEEFLRPGGGITPVLSYSQSSDYSSNSLGLSITFKPGISIGIASQELAEETKPMFMIGYLSKHKELDSYIRGGIYLTYASSSVVNSFGVHGSLSQLFNAQKSYPTSVSANLSAVNFKFKESAGMFNSEISELVPVVGLSVTQAFLANSTASPFLSVGVGHETKNSTTAFMFSVGLNMNFDGPKL